MKATIDATELADACKTIAPALGGTQAIHSMLKVEVDEHSICLQARNDQWGISRKVEASDTEPGSILIPGRPFQVFVGSSAGVVAVRTDNERHRAVISTAGAFMELATGIDERWVEPSTDGHVHRAMPLADLRRIGQIVFAAARDLSRPLLTGVRLHATTASATDTRRIAAARLSVEIPSLTVPAEFFMHVSRQAESDVDVWSGPSGILIAAGGTSWSAQGLVGDFPDLTRYLDLQPAQSVTLARSELLTALKRMTAMDNDTAAVRITVSHDEVVLWTEREDVGEISDRIVASGEFRGQVWFNLRVLTQAVDAHDADQVTFEIETPSDPVLLHGTLISQVVMPRVESSS